MIPVHGKVYSIQHYVMNGFQWLAAGWWVFPVSTTNKIDRHNITEILLKVALSIIPLSHNVYCTCGNNSFLFHINTVFTVCIFYTTTVL